MRLFVALWPPEPLAEQWDAWGSEVRRRHGGRATRVESIHLTLVFLGDVQPVQLARAAAAAGEIAASAFTLQLDQPGYFQHNRIAWIGPSIVPAALTALAEVLAQTLRQAGFTLERRPFTPHVTMLREAREPRAWLPLPATLWRVDDYALVESVREARGVRYEVRERYALPRPGLSRAPAT